MAILRHLVVASINSYGCRSSPTQSVDLELAQLKVYLRIGAEAVQYFPAKMDIHELHSLSYKIRHAEGLMGAWGLHTMANSTSQLIQEQLVHLQHACLATNEVPSDYL